MPAANPTSTAPATAKPASPIEACGRCHYLATVPNPAAGGEVATMCRRNPPQIIAIAMMHVQPPPAHLIGIKGQPPPMMAIQNQSTFPAVDPGDWCGEFIARRGA